LKNWGSDNGIHPECAEVSEIQLECTTHVHRFGLGHRSHVVVSPHVVQKNHLPARMMQKSLASEFSNRVFLKNIRIL
jgi:hypothetical protein